MSKLKIGTRVQDSAGDAGEIMDKRKGERLVRYDNVDFGLTWIAKGGLTVLVAEEARPEICESAYKVGDRVRVTKDVGGGPKGSEGVVDELFSETISRVLFDAPFDGWGDNDLNWYVHNLDLEPAAWVPKVGERVVFNTTTPECGAVYFDGEMTVIDVNRNTVGVRYPLFGVYDKTPLTQEVYLREILPVAEQPAGAKAEAESSQGTWSPVVGRFGKTRDGRKVGPIGVYPLGKFFHVAAGSVGGNQLWRADGSAFLDSSDNDLISEWPAEVAVEAVAVAEATATPLTLRDGETYVGESGAFHTVETNQDNSSWPFKTKGEPHISSRFWMADGTPFVASYAAEQGDRLVSLTLAPSTPAIGSTVTFTATGRLSAVNDNGHAQVTFPDLPAGRNSFALPAEYVAAAN